ncbi:MAG: flagellar export chaperone FliS [Betaproteobacteria bacterium]
MFGAFSNHATAAYRKAGIESQVDTASPHQLVLMLFDGALLAVSTASRHMANKDIAHKGQFISQAIEIIDSGLKAGLDPKNGGELAGRLDALYDYMCTRLLHANLKNDEAALKEVAGLLREIKSAWEEIADDPAVASRNKVAA